MRAVNLIPTDQQRGAGGAAGKSGGAAYILLGALALSVAMTGLFVTSKKSVDDKQSQLTSVTAQAAAAEAKATELASYTKFAGIRAKRVDTVKQLAASRFDWAHALHEVARVLPENAWVTSMTATTSPSVSLAGGGSGSLRSAISSPAISLQGCTTSQASVSKVLARLRLADGVQRVSLEDSTLGADGSGTASGGGGAGGGTDCRGGHAKYPLFNVDIWFDAPSTTVAANTAGAAGTTTTAADTTAASTSTPASTATPGTTSSTAPSTTGGTTK
ncbi:MAG TPA: PilN domain-containing protein [Baekduia sp.]